MARRLPVPTAGRFPATTQDRQPIIKRSKKMPKRAWTDTQAERAVFSRANVSKIRSAIEGLSHGDPLAFELPGCATRNLLPPSAVVLKAYVPDFEVEGVIEGAVNRMPVTKTGNPFCRSIDLSKCLAQTEAGRILQKHF